MVNLTSGAGSSLSGSDQNLPASDDLELPAPAAVGARVRNSQAPWDEFSSESYYAHNYKVVQAEDQEVIHRVGLFFSTAFAARKRADRAIDVGSGPNLYPALLMLPWANRILLSDYSPPNIKWLRREVAGSETPWAWQPFWREIGALKGYDQIVDPRKQLMQACLGDDELAAIERRSVFELPVGHWQLGTMFFVAESITEIYDEFRGAVHGFVRALEPGSPFASTFMAESVGYEIDGTHFPALRVQGDDVRQCFEEVGVHELSVDMTESEPLVRPGYQGMIIATGFVGDR